MIKNKNTTAALVFTLLMLISPLAGAVNVTTFSGGDSQVDVEVRDAPDYTNIVDGTITLPSGDTVTSASFDVGTSFATHSTSSTIDSSTQQFVWDPMYNNQQTEYSALSDFTYNDDFVGLVSGGFSTDFENDRAGFEDNSQMVIDGFGWEHTTLSEGTTLNDNCNTGNDCWGTNPFDYDNDYTNDNGGSSFSYQMITPALQVNQGSHIAKFSSWHGMHWSQTGSATNPTNTYYDCGYVMVRNSSSPDFGPPELGWSYLPFDTLNTTGVNYANGLYPVGVGNGKIQSCDGLGGNDYVLGGQSTHPTHNPNGWGTVALNLGGHLGKYVQLKFVLTHNSGTGSPENNTMPGWFIDDFRVGNPLPQSGWMTVKGFTPKQAPSPGFPDGYGILNIEQESSPTNSLKVTLLRGSTTEIVLDRDGNQMANLEGPIIELWDIDASEYPVIDLKFVFDTGQYRLSTAVIHGISMGTRVGVGMNNTDVVSDPMIADGVWESPGMDLPLMFNTVISDDLFNSSFKRSRFSMPIMSITPVVVDDCVENPNIELILLDGSMVNLTVDTKWTPSEPIFGFNTQVSYPNPCGLSELWYDLEFGHSAKGVTIDVANDGDIEWGMDEPAFGSFGRQNSFWSGYAEGVNHASDSSMITLNTNGQGTGATFMLPKGSDVTFADLVFSGNTAEGFELKLTSSGQEETVGTMPNASIISIESLDPTFTSTFVNALNNLLYNPLLQTSYIDNYGNEWATFHLDINNPNAQSGSSVKVSHLDILYDWQMTLDGNHNLDRELNQGIALGAGADVDVPIAISAGSGGAVSLSNLLVTTSNGYDSTLTLTGNPIGLYPNGDIIEAVSTHEVSSSGASFAEARLRMESSTGVVELSYSELMGFSEALDENNLITLDSSNVNNVGSQIIVTWRFMINPAWEDTSELRIYASLVASDGVNGLPGAVVLAPANGNAIENDAYITAFELRNNAGVIQNLSSAKSNQNIQLIGTVRLENLDISPDPSAYNLTLQRMDYNNSNGTVTPYWTTIDQIPGVIGGDFEWDVNLGLTAAGQADYRFMIDSYAGGDTLCSPNVVTDVDCSIPFNLTIDTYSPTLINISVLKAANYDPTIWSNWRQLLDDTWILPTTQQKVRVLAQDIPTPPSSLDMYYWVEYDHDSNGDGQADEEEYAMITLSSDGSAPTANYTGDYSDVANQGQDPAGKVSIYVAGADLGGNLIEGGSAGFDNDLVTYVSMDAKSPSIRNFFIENSNGERLHNPSEGAPRYQGPWNMTMYAGNEYHLIVEAVDENGWRDISYFEIDLGPENMVVYYSPRNETAWSDTTDIELIPASDESNGPEVLRMDGGRLIDPFESEFYLDLPIKMNWDIVGIDSTTYVPQLRIKDLDKQPSLMSESGGRHKQRWVYSDGIKLDYRNGITPSFNDLSTPYTADVTSNFVFPGDTISFQGQYAFVEGINNGVYILPEGEFTLEVTRLEAQMDGSKGYYQWPGEVTTYAINGGAFNVNITAPPNNNEYTYTFKLIDLPDGAVDSTDAQCEGSNSYGCGRFVIKVDGQQPEIASDTWTASSGINGEVFGAALPSSTMHCVDVQAIVEENAALLSGEVQLNWGFYSNAETNMVWAPYGQTFGIEPMTASLTVKLQGSDYLLEADCIDIWPDQVEPSQTQIEAGVEIVFWVSGRDSAGWSIDGGGPNQAGGISEIWSSDPSHNSLYVLIHQQAEFEIMDVRMTPKNPNVGDTPEIEISIKNVGTMDGNITLEIQSVTDGGFPVTEATLTTEVIEQDKMQNVFVELEQFAASTTGMYFVIVDSDSNMPLWNGSNFGKAFNVAEAEEEGGMLSGSGLLIIIGLAALIIILLVVVLVLARRGSEDEKFEYVYDDEDEFETYSDTPAVTRGPPPSAEPAASLDPKMAAALAEFPQWDQATIQGYFDQGWDIDSLRDWVNSNQ
ncbi:MAG: hypothetical protein QGI21_04555 [Candidatus Poseidoniaceae archaeon]|jgi:hypothetical protein|nr:hypothetical protein [Candidatus Poseidoniaceae archaeon]